MIHHSSCVSFKYVHAKVEHMNFHKRKAMQQLNHFYLFLCPLLASIFLAGCGGKVEESRELLVRLGWQVNANSAGQIVALEKGYYEELGVAVKLLPGGLANPSVKTVGSGAEDIGFANSPDLVIHARSAGVPLRIIAVIHQTGYHAFFSRVEANIRTPHDWIGKRVGVKYGSPTYLYYLEALRKNNIDRKSIVEIPVKYGLQSFLNGDIDVYPGALTNEGIALERRGLRIHRLSTTDLDMKTWGNVIFTTEEQLKSNRDAIRSFIKATIKGWQYCVDIKNEDEVLDLIARHTDEIDREKERVALRLTTKLVSERPIGSINLEDFSAILDREQQLAHLNSKITVAKIIDESLFAEIHP